MFINYLCLPASINSINHFSTFLSSSHYMLSWIPILCLPDLFVSVQSQSLSAAATGRGSWARMKSAPVLSSLLFWILERSVKNIKQSESSCYFIYQQFIVYNLLLIVYHLLRIYLLIITYYLIIICLLLATYQSLPVCYRLLLSIYYLCILFTT